MRLPGSAGQMVDPQQKLRERIERDAQKRLLSLVVAAHKLADPAARARVGARLADVLWAYDEPRARKLFQTAFDSCYEVPADPAAAERLVPTAGDIRAEILRFVMQRDAAFAARLIESVEGNKQAFRTYIGNPYENQHAAMLLQIAQAVAPKDGATAAHLIRG